MRPFPPLDDSERQPREEMVAPDRGGLQLQRDPSGMRKMTRLELAVSVAIPAGVLLGIVLGQSGAPLPLAIISIALLILALGAFALSGRRPRSTS